MANPRQEAESFVSALHDAVGERLRAASLFGSAARGEWLEGLSDINVLVLLDRIDASVLARAAAPAREAADRGITPLVMGEAEWLQAADVFAVEMADMKEASVTLFGDDPTGTLPAIVPRKLRLQAERELRGKLLHLHGAMLMCADDANRLGEVLIRALPSFTTYMRAALRLEDRPVPLESGLLIQTACELCEADPAPFLRILDARTDDERLEVSLDDPLADAFNTAAERVAAHIDALGRSIT
jgi:predicted nucleotidyltransferase